MVASIDVRGSREFVALSGRLKAADKSIQREFSRALTKATKPLKAAAQASARSKLPTRGGLAERVASSRISTRTRKSGKNVGISLVAAGRFRDQLDQGTVRHPVFGDRSTWVSQPVTPGWFTEPMEKSAPIVRHEISAAMDDIARKIEG